MTKEEIKAKIYDWVRYNFGDSEAEDPSWNIDLLVDDVFQEADDIPLYMVICEFEESEIFNVEIVDYNLTKEDAEECRQDTINTYYGVEPKIVKQGEKI